MTRMLEGEAVLVTGAGGGIGRAIAAMAARHGAAVLVTDIDAELARETADVILSEGGRAIGHHLDVSDASSCEKLAHSGDARDVSVVVNNAGIIRRGRLTDSDALEAWQATIGVDLLGPAHVTRAFLPQLVHNRGAVVNVGSIQCFVHAANSAAYTAAKHGVLGLTRALAAELGPQGVRVTGVAPGMVETEINKADLASKPERRAGFLARTPLGRLGEPDDIANAVVFLASRMSAWTTGVVLPVDGGYLTT